MSVTAKQALVVAKKYTDGSIEGITGSLAGKNCTIESQTYENGRNTIVFKWTADNGDVRRTTIVVRDGTPIYEWTSGDYYQYSDLVIFASCFYRCITPNNDEEFDATKWNEIGSPDGNYDIVETKTLLPTIFTAADRKVYFVINESLFYLWNGEAWSAQKTKWNDITGKPEFATVATSGSYNDLDNTPDIPSKTSDLNNDSDFVSDANYVHTDNNYDATAKGIVDGVTAALADKVDKVTGKGLSTNDYTDNAKAIVDGVNSALNDKVDKITGKGLSTEDYTTAEQTKLSNIESGAQVNVQSDWNQTNSEADDYIKNKPEIPDAQIQSDWNQSDNTLKDFIKNKPEIPAAQIQSDWNQSNNEAKDFIKNKPTLGTASSKDVAESGNASTTEVVMGNDTRLTDSRNAKDVYSWAKAAAKPTYTATEVGAIPSTMKGSNNGVAELDNTGKVPASQLPSFVDDVVEYASISSFPATGEEGKIYVAKDTNKTYRWSGSDYVEISESLALGETSSTAYPGNKGKANADAISAIKDGQNIDSFADVEVLLAQKVNLNSTAGLLKNDGTVDTNSYATSAKAYKTDDTAETALADGDYIPFYDTSASAKRKSLWSNIKSVLKTYFDGIYITSHQTVKQDGITGATVNRYAKCLVPANEAVKQIDITSGTISGRPEVGTKIHVYFPLKNTADNPKIQVGSGVAYSIVHRGSYITTGENKGLLYGAVDFVFEGNAWLLCGNYEDVVLPIDPTSTMISKYSVGAMWIVTS